ncbi:hypothetical protein EDD15DRAFT_2196917 [Pisolithus albus]|nr:hypothetical protein EDD15DRAFT_2196917 [Pisolithus albus]
MRNRGISELGQIRETSSLELRETSNSTPNPMLGISGVASTERLAASLGCSFDGSLRDTPATVANTAVGSEVEEHQEKPRVPPPQGATATSTDRGAQADQEEFREALPKEAEKSTSKSEPGLDPEPHPTAVSDGKDINTAVIESMALIPCPLSLNFDAVDAKFLDNGPKDSDEMRDGEDADPHDVALRSRLVMRDSPTLVIVEKPQQQISCLSAPNPSMRMFSYYRMRSTPLTLRTQLFRTSAPEMTPEMDTQVMVHTPEAVLYLDSNCRGPNNFDAAATSRGQLQCFTTAYRDRTKHLYGLHDLLRYYDIHFDIDITSPRICD